MSEVNNQPEAQVEDTTEARRQPRLAVRILGLLLILTAVLITWYSIVIYLAYEQGQELLQEKRTTTLATQIVTQLELSRQNVDDEQYNLARTRLNWVLQRDPNNSEAKSILAEIDALLNVVPAAETAVPPTATARPLPTPTPGLIGDPDEELARIRRVVANESWQDAISALLTFQFQYPSYERETTDRLLYDAYVAQGLVYLKGDQVELGLASLEQAERLGDLPQEALDYRLWAELYVAGLAYYGVNWDASTYYIRELCQAAPFYQDSCSLLQQALIRLGDQFAFVFDWCPAESYYRQAASYGADAILNDKLGQARANCAEATPIPADPITDTLTITDTQPITNP